MQREVVGYFCIGLLTLVASAAGAAPQVLGPDDRPLERASIVADADAFWVSHDADLPVLLKPDADDHLRFPNLSVARLLVLDAASGKPLSAGRLRWTGASIPDGIAAVTWSVRGGRLDLGCRGGEAVELKARGYRPQIIVLEPQERRKTVLLEPHANLEIALRPSSAGRLWLAAEHELSVIAPFHAAAATHHIDESGSAVIRNLNANAAYQGVIVAPGKAPVVGHFTGLPRRLELTLAPGLTVSGRVLDQNRQPIRHARVRATGAIEALGEFNYRQNDRTDAEGRFTITGLLAGKITVKACAENHACTEAKVDLEGLSSAEPLELILTPGHDLRLVIHDDLGRPAAGATVIDTEAYRKHTADDEGSILFDGVEPGRVLSLEIFGAGLRPWSGRVETDRPEVVLRIPAGGVLEWPILVAREISNDEVVASWSRLNSQGREIADGVANWDSEYSVIRADGLDAGAHRLEVRLPGAATLVSEIVEIGLGEEILLPAAVPERGMAIVGRVLDGATMAPVAGARVSCAPGSPHQFRKPQSLERPQRTITDADGIFLLEGLDPGPCRVIIRAPGYAAWRRTGVKPDDVGADLGDIELDHGMAVVGRVLDRSGRGQGGVTVEISEDAAYAYFAETTARTDHDGWFRADTLTAGRWVLRAQRGEQTARSTIEGLAGETASAELRLGGLRLEGEVWIGDHRATGGHLVLSTEGARGDGIVVMIQSDADRRRLFGVDRAPVSIAVGGDGRFAADGVSSGIYTASYTPPDAGGSPVSRELVVPETEIHRCVIQYSDAGLDGVVIDPDGRPVAGAAVIVQSPDGRSLASGFSDGDGAFVFVGLDPGPVRIGAIHSEYGDAEPLEMELRSGDRVGPVALELRPPEGAELALEVRSAAGTLSGAPVYLVGAGTMTNFTDGQGIAAFSGIEPGRYRACAAAYGGAAGCGPEVELDDGDRRELVLDLGQGGSVNVLLGPMERLPALRVMTADGIDLTSMLMMVSPPMPGPDGVRIGPLKSDQYRITVAMPEGSRQGTIGATEGETAELDLR